jgi:hypothetical protein
MPVQWVTVGDVTYPLTTGSAATTTIADEVWSAWCSRGTTTSMNVTQGTWDGWNVTYTGTWEERERRARERRERDLQRAEEWQRKARAAHERALELLSLVLTTDQLRSYNEHGWFEVISNKNNRWRIHRDSVAGNVTLMARDSNERLASFCAHPPSPCPVPDAHLAQALTLLTDEEAFLRVANPHWYVEPIPELQRGRFRVIDQEQPIAA